MTSKNGTQKIFRITQEYNGRIFYYIVFAKDEDKAMEKFNQIERPGKNLKIKELSKEIGANIYYVVNGPGMYGEY